MRKAPTPVGSASHWHPPPLRLLGIWIFLGCIFFWTGSPAKPASAKPENTIRLVAHRGFTLTAPENSLASIRAAHDLGLDLCEVDLRTTADGRIVLMHDPTLERTTTCTGEVAQMEWSTLKTCRLKTRDKKITRERIPLLKDVLELLQKYPRMELALDPKSVPLEKLVELVTTHHMENRIWFFISGPQKVGTAKWIKKRSPRFRIVVDLLCWWKIEGMPTFVVQALDADALFASEWFFPRFGFQEAKEQGVPVMVYLWGTKNLKQRFRRAVALGADAVSCERPDLLLPLIGKSSAPKE